MSDRIIVATTLDKEQHKQFLENVSKSGKTKSEFIRNSLGITVERARKPRIKNAVTVVTQ